MKTNKKNELMAYPLFAMFPDPSPLKQGQVMVQVQTGMTLRDYFAASALIAASSVTLATIISSKGNFECPANDQAVREAYEIADKMMEQREK